MDVPPRVPECVPVAQPLATPPTVIIPVIILATDLVKANVYTLVQEVATIAVADIDFLICLQKRLEGVCTLLRVKKIQSFQ